MKPRLTDRILAALGDAVSEILVGPYSDARTPAEARALEDADKWIARMAEYRAARKPATAKPSTTATKDQPKP